MRAAWLICLKDLKARLRARSALLIGVGVPLGLACIFNSIFSGISGASVIKLGVVNADHGAVSQQFTYAAVLLTLAAWRLRRVLAG